MWSHISKNMNIPVIFFGWAVISCHILVTMPSWHFRVNIYLIIAIWMFMMMLMLMLILMFMFWCKLSQVFGFFCVPVYLLVYVLKMFLRTNLCVRWCTHSGYVWVHTRGTRLYATYTRFVKNSVYIPRPQVPKKKCRIIPLHPRSHQYGTPPSKQPWDEKK